MSDGTTDMPAWFDTARHVHTTRGTYERETGYFLAGDGLPASGMPRARRLAAAGVTEDPLEIVPADLIAAEASRAKRLADEAAKAEADSRKAAAAERRARGAAEPGAGAQEA